MTSYNLLCHSVQMIFNNKVEILKLGLLPMVIYATAMVFLSKVLPGGLNSLQTGDEGTGAGFPMVQVLVAILAMCVAMLSFTVNWHRYVLLEERPQSWISSFDLKRIGAYFIAGFKLGIFIFFIMVPVSIFALSVGVVVGAPIFFAAFVLVSVYATQLSITLPAAAIGKPINLLATSEYMKGSFWTVFALILLLLLANVLIFGIVALLNNGMYVTTATCVQFIAQVFISMLNVSILTTLYGYYVEGRRI